MKTVFYPVPYLLQTPGLFHMCWAYRMLYSILDYFINDGFILPVFWLLYYLLNPALILYCNYITSFLSCDLHFDTVKPPVSRHPQDQKKWPLKRGVCLWEVKNVVFVCN